MSRKIICSARFAVKLLPSTEFSNRRQRGLLRVMFIDMYVMLHNR